MASRSATLQFRLITAFGALAALFAWERFASAGTLRLLISTPSAILRFASENGGRLASDTITTTVEAFSGLVLALLMASLAFMLVQLLPSLGRVFRPLILTSQVVPIVVFAPFFQVALGNGMPSKIAMAALISFFPILVNLIASSEDLSRDYRDFLELSKATAMQRFRHVQFPMATRYFFSGARTAANLSIVGAVVAEFTGARQGLGKNLLISTFRIEPELMISSIALCAVVGLAFHVILGLAERRFGWWYLDA